MIWYFIGTGAALLTMFGFVPQIFKMLRTKSVKDVSLGTLVQFCIGAFLWMLYGIHLMDIIIIIANTVIFFIVMTALIVYLKNKD